MKHNLIEIKIKNYSLHFVNSEIRSVACSFTLKFNFILNKFNFIYCLLNDKNYAQKVWSKDLVYEKLFGY